MIDTKELKVAIIRSGLTNREIAKGLGVSEQAFYNKLNNISEFRASEIKKLADLICLDSDGINQIFFNHEVN